MRRSSYRNASQQSVAGFVAMVIIRYFSGANDKKSAKKYAKAVGENCKARERSKRKRKHSYRKLGCNAGADAALGSWRDVEEDDGLSLREDQTKRRGRKAMCSTIQ